MANFDSSNIPYLEWHGEPPDYADTNVHTAHGQTIVGYNQINLETAREQYDPDATIEKLKDRTYNNAARDAIIGRLNSKYGTNKEVLIGYNGGEGTIQKWHASGRDDSVLTDETRDYVRRAGARGVDLGPPELRGGEETNPVLSGSVAAHTTPLVRHPAPSSPDRDAILASSTTEMPAAEPDIHPEVHKMVKNTPELKEASNWVEAVEAGFQWSASNLAHTMAGDPLGKKPTLTPSEHSKWLRELSGVTQTIGDLPVSIATTIPSFIGGAAATSETGPGAVVGGTLASGFSFGAAPEAVRQVYNDINTDPDKTPKTPTQVGAMIANSTWEITKAGVESAVGFKYAGKAAKLVEAAGGSKLMRGIAGGLAFNGAATATHSAVTATMPDPQDFAVQSMFVLGMHVVPGAAGKVLPKGTFRVGDKVVTGNENDFHTVIDNLKKIYTRYGVPPHEAVLRAQTDPAFRDEILARDVAGKPAATPLFRRDAKPEPDPVRPTPGSIAREHEADVSAATAVPLPDKTFERITEATKGMRVTPGMAREYGVDPAKFESDPGLEDATRTTILKDLYKRFNGKEDAVLAAYHSGDVANGFRALRDENHLPPDTRQVLEDYHAEDAGEGKGPPRLPPEDMSDDARRQRFESRIGTEGEGVKKQIPYGWEFELDFLHRIDNELRGRNLLGEKDLGLEDLFRMTYGSGNRFTHFVKYGPVDTHFAPVDAPSLDAVEEAFPKGGNRSDFNRYVSSLRHIEKAKQGIDSGLMTDADAAANVKELQGGYKEANRMFQQHRDAFLKYMRDSDMVSKDQEQAMKDGNLTSYISWRRIMGDDKAFDVGSKTKKFFSIMNPLKKMEGSNRQIVDPWIASMDNERLGIMMADRNRAALALVDMPTAFLEKLGITKEAIQEGIGENKALSTYNPTTGQVQVMSPLAVPGKWRDGNNFTVWRNGKPEVWRANDENIARMIRGAETTGEMNWVMRVLQFPTKLERAGITGDPTFGARVGLKHQGTAWAFDNVHPAPVFTFLNGIMDVMGKTDAYKRALANGALSGVVTDIDKSLDERSVLEKTGVLEKVWNSFRHPIQFAHAITETVNSATRIGYIKKAQAQGYGDLKASMKSRVAFVDMSERMVAQWANNMSRVVPFFRPAMFTNLKIAGTAMAERPFKSAAYIVGGLLTSQVVLHVLNHMYDQTLPPGQRYKDIPQYERDNFWITPPINGVRMRLARPFVLGPLVQVPFERVLNKMLEQDPNAFDDVLHEMGDVLPPVVPTLARPVMEGASNYNVYTGHPLLSDGMKARTRDMQYSPYTSQLSKKIAALTGGAQQSGVGLNSPPVIDNFIKEWGGTYGIDALKALNHPLGKPDTPWQLADIPIVGQFFVRNPGMSAQSISNFYTVAQKFEALHSDVSMLVKQGRDQEAIQMKGEIGKKAQVSQLVQRALSVTSATIQGVNESTKMSTDEKRQLADELVGDSIQVAEFATKVLNDDPDMKTEEARVQARELQAKWKTDILGARVKMGLPYGR